MTDLQAKIKELNKVRDKARSINGNVEKLEREVYKLTCEAGVEVSDHAIVRYLERVAGIDIEALKRKMLTDSDRAWINSGATRVKKGDRQLVCKDGVVVTVI